MADNSSTESKQSLPQNIEAEQTVLAACLLSPGVFEEVVLSLKPEHFFRPAHRSIFETMREMNARSITIDVISLADHLKAKGQLEAIGGQSYLLELTDNTFALTSWQHHTEIVKRDALRRELLFASARISSLAYDSPVDTKDLVSQAEATLFGITEQTVSNTFKDIKSLVIEANDNLNELANKKAGLAGVPSGFTDVDALFNGFRGGDLIILAARPAVGKTSFAMNLAVNAAKNGVAVAFFSLEMPALQIVQRLICSEAGLNLSRLRSGRISDSDWMPILEASDNLSKLNMVVDDSPSLSITELRTKARRFMKNNNQGMIIVDYLQLMNPAIPRRDGNRAVEVGEISRGLKVLAKELNVPIIALAQLSRGVEQRRNQRGGDKRPVLSDLRESGSIEQDADIVMFLDRSTSEAEAESDSRPDWGVANLIVAKNRNGAVGDIKLTFIPENTKFTDHYDTDFNPEPF